MLSYCRLCAETKADDELISGYTELEEMLSNCSLWKISESESQLPQRVCFLCIEQLSYCFDFMQRVKIAENRLIELFVVKSEINEEIIAEELEPPIVELLKYEVSNGFDDGDSYKFESDDNNDFQNEDFQNEDFQNDNADEKEAKRPRRRQKPFDEILTEDNYLSSGTISHAGVQKLENEYPDMKTVAWNNCQYFCRKCDRVIEGLVDYISHFKSTHFSELKEYRFICQFCRGRAPNFQKLNKHIAEKHYTHLTYRCFYCTDVYWNRLELKKHQSLHSIADFHCEICNKDSMKLSNLESHIRSKHNQPEKIYEKCICDICKKEFSTKESVRSHIMNMHAKTDPPKHVCDQCGQSFRLKGNMIGHILSVHSEKRPFQCDYCSKSYKTKTNLKTHMRTHQPTKDHCCEVCGKKFHSKSQLTAHLKTHDAVGAYNCQFCGKNFKQRYTWQVHERIHTGDMRYTCPACTYKTNSWGNLNKHTTKQHGIDLRSDRWKNPPPVCEP